MISVNPEQRLTRRQRRLPEVCALDQFAVPSAAAIFPEALEGVGVPQRRAPTGPEEWGVPCGGYGRGCGLGQTFIAVSLWVNVPYYNRGQGMIKIMMRHPNEFDLLLGFF